MTTLGHMSANLRRLKRFPGWISLLERPISTGIRGSYANESAIPARKLPRNAAPSKTDLDTQIATEELALAALIHSELMSIRLPNVSYACLKGKTVPCRAIGGDFFDAIALTDSLCAVVADVSGKGAPAAIVAAMLQGIIHAQMLADQPLTAIAGMVNEFLCSRATRKFATMVLLKVRANGKAEYLNCGHVPRSGEQRERTSIGGETRRSRRRRGGAIQIGGLRAHAWRPNPDLHGWHHRSGEFSRRTVWRLSARVPGSFVQRGIRFRTCFEVSRRPGTK